MQVLIHHVCILVLACRLKLFGFSREKKRTDELSMQALNPSPQ